jgi:hypothetical protein
VIFSPDLSNWLRLREEKVVAKGKGELVTYWLEVKSDSSAGKSSCSSGSGTENSVNSGTGADLNRSLDARRSRRASRLSLEKTQRLIDWNTETLLRLLQKTVDNRSDGAASNRAVVAGLKEEESILNGDEAVKKNPFDEVIEIISLPQAKSSTHSPNDQIRDISTKVSDQLRDYVANIARMYNDNQFHSFEHVRLQSERFFAFFILPC